MSAAVIVLCALFSQGKLEMWVEMYPKDQALPTVALDISPRKPERYATYTLSEAENTGLQVST